MKKKSKKYLDPMVMVQTGDGLLVGWEMVKVMIPRLYLSHANFRTTNYKPYSKSIPVSIFPGFGLTWLTS